MSDAPSTSEEATFRSFVELLKSGKISPAVPKPTARQAVAHFLATRPVEDVDGLLSAALPADIWDDDETSRAQSLQECFKDSLQLRLKQPGPKRSWIHSLAAGKDDGVASWLQPVLAAAKRITLNSRSSLAVKRGVLYGLQKSATASRPLLRLQSALEDEVVMQLASGLGAEQGGEASKGRASALMVQAAERLSASDLASTLLALPSWKTQVLAELGVRRRLSETLYEGASEKDAPLIAQALEHTFKRSLSVPSRKGKGRAWMDMGDLAADLNQKCSANASDNASAGPLLAALLQVGPAIIDEISEQPLGPKRCQGQATADAPLETQPRYQDLLYGCLDVIVARAKEPQILELLEAVQAAGHGAFSDAFTLLVMEQVLSKVTVSTMRERFWPLCKNHLEGESDPKVKEAAHSLVLAMLALPQLSNQDAISQSWAGELVQWYCPVVVRDVLAGRLTAEQAKVAVKAIGHTASTVDPRLLSMLVSAIDSHLKAPSTSSSAPTHLQALRLCLIAILPDVPVKQLRRVLYNDIRPIILDLAPHSADRTDLCQALYNEISTGLGDQAKLVGYRFWLEERADLVGEGKAKARL